MNYGIYKNARNASWQCLIDCHVTELPVKPVKIAKNYGVVCKENSDFLISGISGKVLQMPTGEVVILVHPEQSDQRKRYTILHELGHYLLGHLNREPQQEDEYAAERFAAGVLMPACVLWGLGLRTAHDIACVCNVSQTAAKIRAERMAVLYQRNMFLTSPLERQVYEQFQAFINSTKSDKDITI